MKVRLFSFLILISVSLHAQIKSNIDLNKYLNVLPDGLFNDEIETDVFVLGEEHNHDNLDHKLAILFELNKNRGINKLLLEYPIIIQGWCNEYLNHGQEMNYLSKGGDPTIIFGDGELFPMLNAIREYNLKFAFENPIEIICFDIPDDPYASVHFWLKEKFVDLERVEELGLYKSLTLFDQQVNNENIEKDIKFLINDLYNNGLLYSEVLKNDFEIYSRTIQGLEIVIQREHLLWQEWYSLREVYIANVLIEKIDFISKGIIFCGNSHAIKIADDNTVFGNHKFTSFSSVLKKKVNKKLFTIGLHYNTPLIKELISRDRFNLLEEPLRNISSKEDDYTFIKGDQLQKHPRAAKRYDMIIIRNERRRIGCTRSSSSTTEN